MKCGQAAFGQICLKPLTFDGGEKCYSDPIAKMVWIKIASLLFIYFANFYIIALHCRKLLKFFSVNDSILSLYIISSY